MVTRVLRTQAVTLSHVFDPEEIPTPASGSVTVTISRLDGTVVSTGNATGPDENDAYTYPYAGGQLLDVLIVTWSATVAGDAITLDQDRLEIVGGHMFGIAQARSFDPVLGNVNKYPTSTLTSTRVEVEDEAETLCEQAIVPRFCREALNGDGTPALRLSWPLTRALRSIKVRNVTGDTFVDFTTDQINRTSFGTDGVLRLDSGFEWGATLLWGVYWPPGVNNVIVEYEHGLDYCPPAVQRAGKTRLRSMVLETTSALPDRAERIAVTEVGTVLLAIPSRESTGIPSVDAAYQRLARPRPGFG